MIVMAMLLTFCEEPAPPLNENRGDTSYVPPPDEPDPPDYPWLMIFADKRDILISEEVKVGVQLIGAYEVSGFEIVMKYDQNRLRLLHMSRGEILGDISDGWLFTDVDDVGGVITLRSSFLEATGSTLDFEGSERVFELQFEGTNAGSANLELRIDDCHILDANGEVIVIKDYIGDLINVR